MCTGRPFISIALLKVLKKASHGQGWAVVGDHAFSMYRVGVGGGITWLCSYMLWLWLGPVALVWTGPLTAGCLNESRRKGETQAAPSPSLSLPLTFPCWFPSTLLPRLPCKWLLETFFFSLSFLVFWNLTLYYVQPWQLPSGWLVLLHLEGYRVTHWLIQS